MSGYRTVDYLAIGRRARQMRQEKGMTQWELAKAAGVSNSFIGHIERAEKIPSLETMARLADALEVTLDWLVFGITQRCEQQECPLYGDMKALLAAYGLNDFRAR